MPRGSTSRQLAEWRARLRWFVRWQSTVVEFCRAENVSVASFYQWRHKLPGVVQTPAREVAPTAAEFLPVHVAPPVN